ncbi:IS66-like element accessory protein TnpA [Zwartia sp.]|uniref:IS66-like element accessory protein TnpA n=1 Tax=Zwartia sp. TaxID=2978004 RepID=UPI00271AE06C|nr:transposase [Zwartia sp.]MDO9025220.1 transposase [Zwartia sp.]
MTDFSELPFRKRPRQHYTLEFKRQAVEQTLKHNASAASVALTHGMNANLLLRWRREYLSGKFGAINQTNFIPVKVSTVVDAQVIRKESCSVSQDAQTGSIEILFDQIKLRIQGRPDAHTLRTVIESLRT